MKLKPLNLKQKLILIFLSLILIFILSNEKIHFFVGGVFINIGYRFQDHVDHADDNSHSPPKTQINNLLKRNQISSYVRKLFPRSVQHPKIAILTCMDARLDTVELMGDTRRSYYTIRSAGSVMDPLQQEMLELSVEGGVNVIVLTKHTDCAAEKAVKDGLRSLRYKHLSDKIRSREQDIHNLLNRELISSKIKKGELIVLDAIVRTEDGSMSVNTVFDEDYYN